jgi:acyl-coenzyme A synthetase/AMP-(fatty) acid ligase
MGFSTIAGFTHAVACLISGTPLFCEESWSHIPLLIEKFSIECLDGAPAQLISLIELESDRRRFRSLKLVKYVGAAMSASQLKRIRDGLCDNVMNLYGSTEVGHVAARSMTATTDATAIPGVVGHLFPNVAVEFVDDFGDPALADTSGRIRIKGRFMASGYHNDPNASSELFKDGWFYPGDIGYMTRDRQLVVTGRESETINRGGDKLSPTEIEDLLADVTGVRECAAFKCRNPRGFEDIAVAFVLAEDFDIRSVHDIIRENVTAHRRPCAYIRVNKIPRNGMGKVMRGKLTEIFSDYILKQSAL